MMWLTDLFIDYIPLYSKFRAVESILVIAEFTLPRMILSAADGMNASVVALADVNASEERYRLSAV